MQMYTYNSKSHAFLGFVGFGRLTKHSGIVTLAFIYNNRKNKSETETGPDSLTL